MRKHGPTLRYFKRMKLLQSLPPIGVLVLALGGLFLLVLMLEVCFPLGHLDLLFPYNREIVCFRLG